MPHRRLRQSWVLAIAALLLLVCSSCASLGTCRSGADRLPPPLPAGYEVILAPVADPMEPLNRGFADFNSVVARHILHPATQLWDFLVPAYLQERLGCFGENLTYPVRVVNHLLQGEWGASWTDTRRFVINSTVGVLGLWDPATCWNAPHVEGSFSQTLRDWRTPEGVFFNVPLMGPGTMRDFAGNCVDLCLNPLGWLLPMAVNAPLQGGLTVNRFNQKMPEMANLLRSGTSYEVGMIGLTMARESQESRYVIDRTRTDYDADQTFGALMTAPRDARLMYRRARNRHADLPDGSRIPYSCWPVRGAEKIAVILPGIGGHRHSDPVYALAEQFLDHGFAVIAFSSTFTDDYFLHLAGNPPPGYLPEDARTLSQAISAAVADYRRRYHGAEDGQCVILGYSLGALNALHLAALENESGFPGGLKVDKYLAINPPVHVVKALGNIDAFFALPSSWPSDGRRERLHDLAMRLGAFLQPSPLNPPSPVIPLTREESQFAIGLYMRAVLADTLMALEKASPSGLFRHDASSHFHRNRLFLEAMGTSYADYMVKVVMPWYQRHFDGKLTARKMEERADLPALSGQLTGDRRIHVFQNRNDFLIDEGDLAWYRGCFGDNFHLFDQGGHIGNMSRPEYQKLLVGAAMSSLILH